MTFDELRAQTVLLGRVLTDLASIQTEEDFRELKPLIRAQHVAVRAKDGVICVRLTETGKRALESGRELTK